MSEAQTQSADGWYNSYLEAHRAWRKSEAEIERLRKSAHEDTIARIARQTIHDSTVVKVEKHRLALQFYADWQSYPDKVLEDNGKTAQAELKQQ